MSETLYGATPGGALVISLDFELLWGVRDRLNVLEEYADALHGARRVVPRLLDLFTEYDVAATWATVGFLFANGRAEMMRFNPEPRPTYSDDRLDPYHDEVGIDEADDPLHLAPSLIDLIASTPRQEIATHTYSHYYCGEPGQTEIQFEADLGAAVEIASEKGHKIRSIVYPRNQHNPTYVDALRRAGIIAYRGNPKSWMWRFAASDESAALQLRLGRLADSYVNLSGTGAVAWNDLAVTGGVVNVPASAFLRPYRPVLRSLEGLRLQRMCTSMRRAAEDGKLYHVWWHPHNMGRYQDENLDFLRRLLHNYAFLRDTHGMRSISMRDVAEKRLRMVHDGPFATT